MKFNNIINFIVRIGFGIMTIAIASNRDSFNSMDTWLIATLLSIFMFMFVSRSSNE